MIKKDEWTQEEFLKNKKAYKSRGIEVLLIDTINSPIEGTQTILYNPFEIKQYPKGTILAFYCDTGKSTKERLSEYRKKFPDFFCVSLRGGRGYWRKTLRA